MTVDTELKLRIAPQRLIRLKRLGRSGDIRAAILAHAVRGHSRQRSKFHSFGAR